MSLYGFSELKKFKRSSYFKDLNISTSSLVLDAFESPKSPVGYHAPVPPGVKMPDGVYVLFELYATPNVASGIYPFQPNEAVFQPQTSITAGIRPQ